MAERHLNVDLYELDDRTKVIAYYLRADGVYERREMWVIDYEEAIAKERPGRSEGFDQREREAWSLEAPPEGATIKNLVPPPRTIETLPEAVPPMVKRQPLTAVQVQRKVRTGVAGHR